MSDSTRRGFVKNSAATAAGMTVVGALVAEQADAKAAAKSGPVVAYIRDPAHRRDLGHGGRARGEAARPQDRGADRPRGELRRQDQCHLTAKRRRSARTRSPTTPTCTRSSRPTIPARSRSSRTTCRSRRRSAVRTSSSSAPTSATASTSTTTATATRTSSTSSRSRPRSRNPNSFLYNSGPILSIDSANWNRKQFYSVTRISRGRRQVLGAGPGVPAVQHRPALDAGLRHAGLAGGPHPPRRTDRVRRAAAEGFYVDLGSIFDLGNLRPFEQLQPRRASLAGGGRRRQRHRQLQRALDRAEGPEVGPDPQRLDADRRVVTRIGGRRVGVGEPAGRDDPRAVVASTCTRPANGCRCRASAIRCSTRCWSGWGSRTCGTRSRRRPTSGSRTACSTRSSRRCCPCCTRACSRTWPSSPQPRADLVAILLTGLPAGIVPGFQNYTGSTLADMLRLNLAIPPSSKPEHARADRRRPRRVPERPARVRRRRHGRAAGDRRGHISARQQELHARRGGRR